MLISHIAYKTKFPSFSLTKLITSSSSLYAFPLPLKLYETSRIAKQMAVNIHHPKILKVAVNLYIENPACYYDELTFDDSEDIPDWAIDYVKIVVNEGYVKGYEDNTIRPNNNISRAEAATIISSMFAG